MIETILLDRRNYVEELPVIIDAIQCASFIGLDCETHDDGRHQGLNLMMKVNEETRKKAGNTRLIFDMRRTEVCGFSVYPEGCNRAWYINMGHADVENRLTFEEVRPILDAKKPEATWLSHNAPFELTVFKNSLGYDLVNILCTMQLSVTAFGDDNYDINTFNVMDLRGLSKWPEMLLRASLRNDMSYDDDLDEESTRKFNREIEDMIGKITSKTSDAAHSYNGYVDEIAYGHGLKQLINQIFGYQMGTFKDTIGDNAHMGQLTGEQVRAYGAEDAYWVVPLFRHLLTYTARNSPNALNTFFTQENPMIHVYSELWRGGMRVNKPAIDERRELERATYANLLRSLRAALRGCGDFPAEHNESLAYRQPWYAKNWDKYRAKIVAFRDLEDVEDDLEECLRVSSPVGNAWAEERGFKCTSDLSIMHYMPVRVILYDLLQGKMQFDMGKLTSDGEARAKVKDSLTDPAKQLVIDCLTAMAGLEQRMKLYLTPYTFLTDPETDRLYPTVNSLLNTRRLAASTPNPMQLSKRGDSTYVRGFFLGDEAA